MKRLALAAVFVCALAPCALAQSMNVPRITEQVVGEICPPFLRDGDMYAAIAAAEGFGYSVVHYLPTSLRLGAADRQPPPFDVAMEGSHQGTVRLFTQYGLRVCSVGIHEGGVARIAEVAEPHLRALGMEPVLDEREGRLAVSVWRGPDIQAVISRSPEFPPGSELVITAVGQDD